VGVRHHPVLPAENSHHEVEQPPRVPAGEQDREPGEDDGEDYGCLLQQKYLPFETPEEAAEMVAEIMARPSLAEEYPYLAEVAVELAKRGFDYKEEFESGLTLVLDGIERLRKQEAASTGSA
jgi:hypothetical protein